MKIFGIVICSLLALLCQMAETDNAEIWNESRTACIVLETPTKETDSALCKPRQAMPKDCQFPVLQQEETKASYLWPYHPKSAAQEWSRTYSGT